MHYYTLKYNFKRAINPGTWVVAESDKTARRIPAPPQPALRITKQIDQDWGRQQAQLRFVLVCASFFFLLGTNSPFPRSRRPSGCWSQEWSGTYEKLYRSRNKLHPKRMATSISRKARIGNVLKNSFYLEFISLMPFFFKWIYTWSMHCENKLFLENYCPLFKFRV